jgi:antitoxin VapB
VSRFGQNGSYRGGFYFEKRYVRLLRIGRAQAVRIPREFELSGEKALIRKAGNTLILEPVPRKTFIDLLRTLEPIQDSFPPIHDPPAEEVLF